MSIASMGPVGPTDCALIGPTHRGSSWALLGRGEIAGAHQVLEQVLYPHHYFEAEEMALEFPCAAQRKAAQYHRQGRSAAAADLMNQAIEPFAGLVADWPWPALRQAKGLTALNDYGTFLE